MVRKENGILYYFSNPNNWNILSGQYFTVDKPKGTYRIFTFGESTTEGSIRQGKVSFTKFLDWKLRSLLPSIPIEIINFGKAGETSAHVLRKVKIALKYNPDLFIIYSGHNEFIRFDETTNTNIGIIEKIFTKSYLYSRLFKKVLAAFIDQIPLYITEIRKLEDEPICKPEEFKKIQEDYKGNVTEIVRIAKNSNIEIILSNVVGNYEGWEPNRSIHKAGLSDEKLRKWRYHFFRGSDFLKEKKLEYAISEFKEAKKIDDSFAELNFLMARAYEEAGSFQEAKKEYINAVDNDGDPKIAPTLFRNAILKTCDNYKIPCMDVINAFERVSEKSLIGYNIMVDAHHPNMLGELLIAKEIIRVMVDHNLIVPSQQWSFENDRSDDWYLNKPDLTPEDEILYHQNRGLWFLKLSTRRYDPKDRLQRARLHFEKAYEIDPNSFRTYIGFTMLDLLENNYSLAKVHIQKACNINPIGTFNVLKDIWISYLLSKNHLHINESCQTEST